MTSSKLRSEIARGCATGLSPSRALRTRVWPWPCPWYTGLLRLGVPTTTAGFDITTPAPVLARRRGEPGAAGTTRAGVGVRGRAATPAVAAAAGFAEATAGVARPEPTEGGSSRLADPGIVGGVRCDATGIDGLVGARCAGEELVGGRGNVGGKEGLVGDRCAGIDGLVGDRCAGIDGLVGGLTICWAACDPVARLPAPLCTSAESASREF